MASQYKKANHHLPPHNYKAANRCKLEKKSRFKQWSRLVEKNKIYIPDSPLS